jgi:hypothetical protein
MVLFLLAAAVSAAGESLWSPAFKGYIAGGGGFAVGDTLLVQIDASTSLTFTASTTDSKNLTLEFSGGSAGDLFSFLPQVKTGGTLSTTGRDNLALQTQIPVVVTAVAPDGSAQVQGSRTISLQGKNESITVSGTVSPGTTGRSGTVSFSRLANARLAYTTLLSPSANVLSAADLQSVVTAAAAAAAPAGTAAAAPAPAAGAPAATGAPATTGAPAAAAPAAPQTTLAISDARKKELLLIYLNRLLDVLFAQ